MKRNLYGGNGAFKAADYFKITILGFAMSALWQSMHTIILPLRLLDFVAEPEKNTYLGIMTFTGLLLAMVVQPIAGAISDHSGFLWGRRRPFILLGIMFLILLLPGIGLAGSYAAVFAIYCLMQISNNTAQGPYQGFIPDLVPKDKRGRASGVKTLLEIAGGAASVLLISTFMDNYSAGEGSQWLWLSLAIPGAVLLIILVVTLLTVKEEPGSGKPGVSILSTVVNTFRINIRDNRVFIWFLVSRTLIFMAFSTIQQFALYFLRDVIGVTNPAEAAATFSVVAIVGMLIVVYPAGHLSDRIGRKPIGVISALLMALVIAVVIFAKDYTFVLVAAAGIGVAVGAFTSTNWALAVDLVAKGEEARYLGLANMATAGGAALSRLIGPVIDRFEAISADLGYQVMLAACCIYCIAGALILLKVKFPSNQASQAPPPSP
ncbi:MAG TPA: SLC45 family MFS transporter [Dehalococcoidia bacterium]|nr:SLC45 family MFS transporter [Dehalococcoidia bacterium]